MSSDIYNVEHSLRQDEDGEDCESYPPYPVKERGVDSPRMPSSTRISRLISGLDFEKKPSSSFNDLSSILTMILGKLDRLEQVADFRGGINDKRQ